MFYKYLIVRDPIVNNKFHIAAEDADGDIDFVHENIVGFSAAQDWREFYEEKQMQTETE